MKLPEHCARLTEQQGRPNSLEFKSAQKINFPINSPPLVLN